jgi:hypothetical protein
MKEKKQEPSEPVSPEIDMEEIVNLVNDLRIRLRSAAGAAHFRAKAHFDAAADLADRLEQKLVWVQSVVGPSIHD